MDVFDLAAKNHIADIVTTEPGRSNLCSVAGNNLFRSPMPFEVLPSIVRGSLEPARIDGEYGLLFKSDEEFWVFGTGKNMPGFKTRTLEICNEWVTVPQQVVDISRAGLFVDP